MATSEYVSDFNSSFRTLTKVVNKISNAKSVSELNLAQREARRALQLVQFRALDLARWVEGEVASRRKTLRETTFVEIRGLHSPAEEIPVKVTESKKPSKRTRKK